MTSNAPTPDSAARRNLVVPTLRRLLILLGGTVGIAVATAGPALAGVRLNHAEPLTRLVD